MLRLAVSRHSPIARAEFKYDQPQLTRVDATACALAAESPSSVRQYIWRTRMIYGLQMSDYVRFVGDEPKAVRARCASYPIGFGGWRCTSVALSDTRGAQRYGFPPISRRCAALN